MKKSKLLLILALVVVLALGVLVSCKGNNDCAHENYGAWSITKAPTLTEDGEAVRICADCNVAETTTVAKLSDTSVWTPTTTSATHTTAGKTTYTSTYGTVVISVDPLVDHVYDKEVVAPQYLVSAADCTNAAVYRKSCSCGAVGTATFTSGAALGHQGHAVDAVAAVHNATTLTNGVKAHYACDRCGKLFSDAACTTEVTAASLVVTAAHNYGGWTLVSDATCTTDGSVTHTCETCGKVETNVIPAHDHVYTSGKMVLVTENGSYWDEDGSVVEGDDEATEFHAPVCDICHIINKNAKVEHNYSDWELVIRTDINGHEVVKVKTCDVCAYSVTHDISCGYLEQGTTWTAGTTVAATYTSDGYTEYTSTHGTVRLVLPKLVAPYEGKTFTPMEINRKDGVVSSTTGAYHWSGASITVDGKGTATGTASPFNGNVVITMDDENTGAITLTVGNNTFEGYVEPLTGIMVISDDGFASVYLVSPYEMTLSSVVGSYWTNTMALSYHVDCGTYLGHDIGIYVDDGVVYFGATFEDANGALVAANECYNSDVLVVNANDSVLVTLVKDNDGLFQVADALRGTYTATEDTMDMGRLVVDGIGGFVLPDADSPSSEVPLSGTYAAREDGKYDAYVIFEGKKIAYIVVTLDADTYALDLQMITITLDAGTHGTVEQLSEPVYANCFVDLPDATADAGYEFVGWYTANGTDDNWGEKVTDATTFSGDITLYAKIVPAIHVSIVDAMGGNKTIVYGVGDKTTSRLPAYTSETINPANNTFFAAWYIDEACTDELDADATINVSDDNTLTIYAKWIPAGTWTSFRETPSATFVYNSTTNAWRTSVYGSTEYHAYFDAIDGDIVISFTWWIGSNQSWDTISIKNAGTTLASGSGSTLGANVHKTCTAIVKAGTYFEIVAKYYSSSSNDTYGVFVSDLTINGRSITVKGTADLLEGAYTSDGKDDLVLNGYGAFTWGTKSGTYAKASDNTFDMYVVENGTNVEYYELTLDGTTYSVNKSMATITFDVPDYCDAVADMSVNKNVAVSELPNCTSNAADGKVFVGWYSKDGSDDDWGDLVTTITLTEDVTLYARWVTPNALFGTYNGFAFGSYATTTVTTVTVNELGIVTSNTMKNAVVDYDPETGAVWFVNGSTKYYGIFDAATGNLVVNASSSTTATIGSAPYVLFRDATVAEQKFLTSKNSYKVVAMEVDGTDRLFLLDADTVHLDVDVVVKMADGTSVSDITTLRTLNSSTNGYVYAVSKDGTHLVSIAYLSGVGVDICDGTEGMYANGDDKVWVLGIGAIMMDGKLGKLVAVDGQENTYIANVGTTSSATPVKESYVITLDVANKTYTIVDNKVEVSFNFAGLSGSLDAMNVFAGVETNLPDAPAITGYTFRGWYNNEGLTGSAITKVTSTADTVIYAKYDKAITVTIVYGNGMDNGSVTDKFANDKVTVALPADKDGLVALDWYTTATFEEGTKWTSGSVVTDDLTIYCKWAAPHALMGTYKGWEAYQGKWQSTSATTLTIDAAGKATGTASGMVTGYNSNTGMFTIVDGTSSRIGYYDSVSNTMMIGFGSNQSAWNDDVYILFGNTDPMPKNYSGVNYAARWKNDGSSNWDNYVVYIVLNEGTADEQVKFIYRDITKIYVDVTVKINNVAATKSTLNGVTTKDNILEIKSGDVTIFKGKYDGTTFIGSDGKQGTYTGTGVLASIELDGYGLVTIGDATVVYTLDDNKITFALNNRMMVVELGDGTCAQVQDGIAGTYTLPDGAGTITFDGLGGAGDGKTYVVNGSNITVYTAEGNKTYGLDVDNKKLAGKSIFANLKFTGNSLEMTFADDVNPNGTLKGGLYEYGFVGTYDAATQTLTITIKTQNYNMGFIDKVITATVTDGTITFSSSFKYDNVTDVNGKALTCADFSL